MASIFTYQEEPPRIHSPWSTPGSTTPQAISLSESSRKESVYWSGSWTKLEPERQDGPTEYKLHLLLRPRRIFTSTSTTAVVPGSHHSRPSLPGNGARSVRESAVPPRTSYQPSGQTREARLQQLTTQLLWRLQQSSPFHSSSNADLVLPVLPEATPRLGVPERPAKLLPGLEESQGALYEIGVADDGQLIGLCNDELEESLTNLRAMAASLGCVTDVLRKVSVGQCEWLENDQENSPPRLHADKLWVAEVLVRPDSRAIPNTDVSEEEPHADLDSQEPPGTLALPELAATEQLRVTLVGATTAGKSSLLGTLSTSTLDNGRGKSRLSLLKHRHEIASGVTSSVAQELIGYVKVRHDRSPVVNYASGDVSSWPDIHNLADRLVFLSDSPGLPRYAKSTFRTLVSWRPHWAILCVAADEEEESSGRSSGPAAPSEALGDESASERIDLTLSHLHLCLRLNLPLTVVITKTDLATRAGLRLTLTKVLSALKMAGRKPVMLSTQPMAAPSFALDPADSTPDLQAISQHDQEEVDRLVLSLKTENSSSTVPIVMTSAVTGIGLAKLHALLRSLPEVSAHERTASIHSPNGMATMTTPLFNVDEVFGIPPSRVYSTEAGHPIVKQGVVLCGHLSRGTISVGDKLCIGPFNFDHDQASTAGANSIQRSKSYGAEDKRPVHLRSAPNLVARSYQGDSSPSSRSEQAKAALFCAVRVVSLRNLQLPVRRMNHGDTGTIGIEPISPTPGSAPVSRARKGMVLLPQTDDLTAYKSFSASFPSSDFSNASSPPLILGGHAIIYLNSIRAAVKVTAVALDESTTTGGSSLSDMFNFDSDDDGDQLTTTTQQQQQEMEDVDGREKEEIKITFHFVSTVEWMEVGDQILVVPTVTTPGPVTGPARATTALSGFVGRVCDVDS